MNMTLMGTSSPTSAPVAVAKSPGVAFADPRHRAGIGPGRAKDAAYFSPQSLEERHDTDYNFDGEGSTSAVVEVAPNAGYGTRPDAFCAVMCVRDRSGAISVGGPTHTAPDQVQRVRFRYWEYRNRAQRAGG